MDAPLSKKLGAEFLGTFVLVLGGVGTAVLAGEYVGFHGIAVAFGLTVVAMAYAVGHISGGHFNPAVTIGVAASGRMAWEDTVGYFIAQIAGAIVAALVLFIIASGKDGFKASDGFGTNGYGEFSPDKYTLLAVLVIEIVMTAVFLYVILGTTDSRAPKGFAPLAIGLSLTLIHLVTIPVSGTSVNPARSIGPALFAGGDHIVQLWVFILAPAIGAAIAGFTYKALLGQETDEGLAPAMEG